MVTGLSLRLEALSFQLIPRDVSQHAVVCDQLAAHRRRGNLVLRVVQRLPELDLIPGPKYRDVSFVIRLLRNLYRSAGEVEGSNGSPFAIRDTGITGKHGAEPNFLAFDSGISYYRAIRRQIPAADRLVQPTEHLLPVRCRHCCFQCRKLRLQRLGLIPIRAGSTSISSISGCFAKRASGRA